MCKSFFLRSFLVRQLKKLLVLIWPLIKTFQTSSRTFLHRSEPRRWQAGQARAHFLLRCFFSFKSETLLDFWEVETSVKRARLQNLEMDILQHLGPLYCSCWLWVLFVYSNFRIRSCVILSFWKLIQKVSRRCILCVFFDIFWNMWWEYDPTGISLESLLSWNHCIQTVWQRL